MTALKCPNPSCPFLFDPTAVPPGAVLTCPRCAMRFTLGPAPAATESAFATTQTYVAESPAKAAKPSFIHSRGMLIVGLAACTAVAFAVVSLLIFNKNEVPRGPKQDKRYRDINLIATVPPNWIDDDDAKKLAKANVVGMKKNESSARIAIDFRSFDTRNPQPGELRDGLISERLEAMFDDLDATQSEGEWLGQKALKVAFRGRRPDGSYAGEAYAIGAHGYAYWLLAWSHEGDFAANADDFESFRTACRFIDPNPKWKPREDSATVFSGGDYSLSDGDQWWEKQDDPKSEDPKTDLLLTAKFRMRPKPDLPPKALAVAYRLEVRGDDPLGTLRAHVKERYSRLFDIKKWHDVTGEPQGDPPAAGMPTNVDVVRYHAESESPHVSKLVVLHAIALETGMIGIEASCSWSDRAKWEKRLIALAASLKK